MPRDANGNYIRPANSFSNPVSQTPINSTDADALFDDFEVALNNSAVKSPEYVVTTANPALPNERVLTAGTGIVITPAATTVTVAINPANVISTTGSPANGQWAQFSGTATITGVATAATPWVQKAGDTVTGPLVMSGGTATLTLNGAPTVALHAATKQYVDTAIASPALTVGTTVVGGGVSGRFLSDNGGVLGEFTAAQASAALDLFSQTSTAKGVVPGSNNAGSTFFLNATGGWSVPAGGTSMGEPSNDGLLYGRQTLTGTSSWQRVVRQSGDTMSGNLTVAPASSLALLKAAATGANSAFLQIDKGASGQQAVISAFTGGLARWAITMGNNTAEGGTSDGSDFQITRYNNSGTVIDTPLTITRSNGIATFNNSVAITSAVSSQLQVNNTGTNSNSVIFGQKNSVSRWALQLGDTATESGGPTGAVGSDFSLFRYRNDGTVIDQPLIINRSTGLAAVAADPTAALGVATKGYVDRVKSVPLNINSAMEVSQEFGTAAQTAVTGNYIVDGFRILFAGTAAYQHRQTDIAFFNVASPGGSGSRSWVSVTTPQVSMGSTDFSVIGFYVEGLDAQRFMFGTINARPVVVRMCIRAPVAGTFSLSLRNDALNRVYVRTITIAAGEVNTDVVRYLTFPGDTTGTWLADTGRGLYFNFVLASGTGLQTAPGVWTAAGALAATGQTNGIASTAQWFFTEFAVYDGTGWATDQGPPFVAPDYASELLRCQRYFQPGIQTLYSITATAASQFVVGSLTYYPTMRVAPTVTRTPGGDNNVGAVTTDLVTTNSLRAFAQSVAAGTATVFGTYRLNARFP